MSKLTKIGPVPVPPGTGLTLRALIPLIPFVGGSASVLVEAKLAERQTQDRRALRASHAPRIFGERLPGRPIQRRHA
jgi:hypothetical protein